MIGVFVRFRFEDDFDEGRLRETALAASRKFEGLPGLRSKAFTVNTVKREAVNFYVWDSAEAARSFFSDTLVDSVATLYGVRPEIDFTEIAGLVDNARLIRGAASPASEDLPCA